MPKSIKKYLSYKRGDCKRKGRELHLSESDIQQLLDDAGITIDQIGNKRGCYVLGRYNDEGEYTMGNCRFITQAQNNAEARTGKPLSEEHKRAVSLGRAAAGNSLHSPETKRKIALSASTRTRNAMGEFVSH